MSDRIPGSSFSNPIWHGKWRIFADDCAGTHPPGFAYVHDDYDPTPMYADDPPSDDRHGWARTVDDAKAEIDEFEEDARRAADMAATLYPFKAVAEIFERAASADTRRMAETRSGSGRSPSGAVPSESEGDAHA